MRIRPFDPTTDEALLMDSWLRSFRDSWFAGNLHNSIWYDVNRVNITQHVRARPDVVTLVCEDDEGDSILGWMCAEPANSVIHYSYTKDLYRRKGVFKALLAAMEALGLREPVQFTFRTQGGSRAVQNRNFVYNPRIVREVKGDR